MTPSSQPLLLFSLGVPTKKIMFGTVPCHVSRIHHEPDGQEQDFPVVTEQTTRFPPREETRRKPIKIVDETHHLHLPTFCSLYKYTYTARHSRCSKGVTRLQFPPQVANFISHVIGNEEEGVGCRTTFLFILMSSPRGGFPYTLRTGTQILCCRQSCS